MFARDLRSFGARAFGPLAAILFSFSAYARPQPSELAQDPAWKNLLYYSSRFLTTETSLVDSQDFFVSPEGAHDPEAELMAFIDALQKDDPKRPEPERIPCRFPARTRWVLEQFPDLAKPQQDCPLFRDWLALSQAKAVTLIFSAYYINNPSSMMGHTFLRLRRGGKDSSPLLDKAVNFAAEPTTEAPLLYTIMGLSGAFPGRFSMSPYYMKVQEYANAESRDLWEYNLAFTEDETQRMLASLWEVAPFSINYYFFDENCSAILIYLLQNARPSLQLSRDLSSLFVHPSDTIRLLYRHPELVESLQYRPSSRSRFLAQEAQLHGDEKRVLRQLLMQELDLEAFLQSADTARQAKQVDAALAFIEFDEKLYGSQRPEKHKDLYEELLRRRAKLDEKPLKDFPMPARERPEQGHLGQRWGLGLGAFDTRGGMLLEWRPGQHDTSSPALGYPPELSIELGRVQFAWHEGRSPYVQRVDLFRILSLNPSRSGKFPWSWKMGLGYRDYAHSELLLDGGIGQAWTFHNRENYIFLMAEAAIKRSQGHYLLCAGPSVGLRLGVTEDIAQLLQAQYAHCRDGDGAFREERWAQSEWRWAAAEHWEGFLSARYDQVEDAADILLGFYQYY